MPHLSQYSLSNWFLLQVSTNFPYIYNNTKYFKPRTTLYQFSRFSVYIYISSEFSFILCLHYLSGSPSIVKTNVKGLQQSYVKTSTEVIDLIECLDAQLATVEPIPDMKCPRCQKSSTSKSCSLNYCQREQWITHTPKYLVLYIQRSDWLNIASLSTESNNIRQFGGNHFSTTRIATKRSEHVHIPEFLNMAPYLLPCRILKTEALSQPVNPYHDKPSGGLLSNTSELLGRE